MRAAERIGKGAKEYAMHVKGLEISAQDGRAQKSMAIAHATSVRGADHLRHCSFLDEVGNPEAIKGHFGEQYLPEMDDRLAIKFKGILAKGCEDFATLLNTLVLCNAGDTFWPPIMWWKSMTEVYEAVTGIKMLEADLQKAADRIICLKRAYNIRLGLSRKEDILPKRFFEPAPAGPCKGQIVELKPMLDEYYKARGWDLESGLIPRSKLNAVGLKDVAKQLAALGKLPIENKTPEASI
jgi:aldehyde:ferredoxin oxidoreductase